MSQIVVLCEIPIQWEQLGLVYIANTCSIWYLPQFVHIAILMILHGPAGACIPVASVSPIHVSPVQCVLKHCGVHKHVIQNNLRTPQLVDFTASYSVKKSYYSKFLVIILQDKSTHLYTHINTKSTLKHNIHIISDQYRSVNLRLSCCHLLTA